METIKNLLLHIGESFGPDVYLLSTKIQGLIWSTADIVLLLVLLRIVDILRRRSNVRPLKWRYVLVTATALITPLLALAKTSRHFLILESLICGTQFLLLVYTLLVERKILLSLIIELETGRTTKKY